MDAWDTYERISDDATGAEDGVGRQLTDNAKAVAALGGQVDQSHTENDTSAYKRRKVSVTDHYGNTYDAMRVIRPVWAKALQRLRSGEATRLMVYDLDRLARDPRDLEDAIEVVEVYGATIRSTTASDVDLATEGGRMNARLMVMIANKASADTARRVKRKKEDNRSKGIRQGGRYRTYGYTRKWEIVPEEAVIIREAFARRLNGESITAIASDLAGRGETNVNDKPWNAANLGKVLERPDYAGLLTYKGEVVGKTAFEAIIDEATYRAVQDKLTLSARRGQNARAHLLTGFLTCSKCFTTMKGNRAANHYRCPSPKDVATACGSCTCKKDVSDEAVFNAAFRKAQDAEPVKTDKPSRDYDAEIKAVQEDMDIAKAAQESGDMLMRDYIPALKALRAREAVLVKEKAADAPEPDLWHFQTFLDFEAMNLSQQRTWISQYVAYVLVYPPTRNNRFGFDVSRLEVHYQDGTVERLSEGVVRDALAAD